MEVEYWYWARAAPWAYSFELCGPWSEPIDYGEDALEMKFEKIPAEAGEESNTMGLSHGEG